MENVGGRAIGVVWGCVGHLVVCFFPFSLANHRFVYVCAIKPTSVAVVVIYLWTLVG